MLDELNRHFLSIDVWETDQNRAYWINKSWAEKANRDTLVGSQILIVPNENFRDKNEPFFPKGTTTFVENIRDLLPEDVNIAIAVDNDKYQELALHADIWRIPTLIISFVVIPVVVGIFTNRLDELLPGHKIEDTVEINLIIEAANKKSLKLAFKGPTAEIPKFLNETVPMYIKTLENESRINRSTQNLKKKK